MWKREGIIGFILNGSISTLQLSMATVISRFRVLPFIMKSFNLESNENRLVKPYHITLYAFKSYYEGLSSLHPQCQTI